MTTAVAVETTALTRLESMKLVDLEMTIEDGLATFVLVGAALAMIREQRLYRETHNTFDEYCQERWGWTASRSRQLIGASDVVQSIESVTSGNGLPPTEKHARALVSVPGEKRAEVWQQAVDTAPKDQDGKPRVTSDHVREVAKPHSRPTDIFRTRRRRPAERVRELLRVAAGLGDVDDVEIATIDYNDSMGEHLRNAHNVIDRIYEHHGSKRWYSKGAAFVEFDRWLFNLEDTVMYPPLQLPGNEPDSQIPEKVAEEMRARLDKVIENIKQVRDRAGVAS